MLFLRDEYLYTLWQTFGATIFGMTKNMWLNFVTRSSIYEDLEIYPLYSVPSLVSAKNLLRTLFALLLGNSVFSRFSRRRRRFFYLLPYNSIHHPNFCVTYRMALPSHRKCKVQNTGGIVALHLPLYPLFFLWRIVMKPFRSAFVFLAMLVIGYGSAFSQQFFS